MVQTLLPDTERAGNDTLAHNPEDNLIIMVLLRPEDADILQSLALQELRGMYAGTGYLCRGIVLQDLLDALEVQVLGLLDSQIGSLGGSGSLIVKLRLHPDGHRRVKHQQHEDYKKIPAYHIFIFIYLRICIFY